MSSRWTVVVAFLLVLSGARLAGAQDTLAAARDLYGAAAYDEALTVLDRIKAAAEPGEADPSVEQVRALCLLAVGRRADAEQAIELVIAANPSFEPDAATTSPRVQAAFRDVRRKVLPGIVQQRYASAKAAFDGKQYWSAVEQFDAVLALIGSPDPAVGQEEASMHDLRTLVLGFRDLARAAMPAATAAGAPVAQAGVADAPPPPPPAARPFYGPEDRDVLPPAAVNQRMPPWTGPSMALVQGRRRGVLEVVIDESGDVERASVIVRTGTVYDGVLADHATRWKYRPATRGGVPVKYRKVIEYTIG